MDTSFVLKVLFTDWKNATNLFSLKIIIIIFSHYKVQRLYCGSEVLSVCNALCMTLSGKHLVTCVGLLSALWNGLWLSVHSWPMGTSAVLVSLGSFHIRVILLTPVWLFLTYKKPCLLDISSCILYRRLKRNIPPPQHLLLFSAPVHSLTSNVNEFQSTYILFLFKNYIYYLFMCMCVRTCTCVQVLTVARIVHWTYWSWSSRWLWATQCGFWEASSALEEHSVLTTRPSLQPQLNSPHPK